MCSRERHSGDKWYGQRIEIEYNVDRKFQLGLLIWGGDGDDDGGDGDGDVDGAMVVVVVVYGGHLCVGGGGDGENLYVNWK